MKALYGRYLNKEDVAARTSIHHLRRKCLHLPRVIEAANKGLRPIRRQQHVGEKGARKPCRSRGQADPGGRCNRAACEGVDRKVEFSSDTEERVRSALDDEGIFVREVAVGCEPFQRECGDEGAATDAAYAKLKEVTEKSLQARPGMSDGNCAWGTAKLQSRDGGGKSLFVIEVLLW